ncbi:hypothetical protein NDI85_17025 [Halomicroarcula sp. S1AR25-4]|uniref:hypothetical protein n=1 Tax=Haloarcula sp. S1AR25-4 TaxID=2950538 RepID=UPI0028759921|nr:hypothetical protein [Halomicroarcula sp. S1AR25-4]MDS0279498.1 hypothetical protein [Halomicroarcula sp. S1AR25-4]
MKLTEIRTRNEEVFDLHRSEQWLLPLLESPSDERGAIGLACNGLYGAKSLYSEWTFSEPDDQARELFAVLADRKQQHLERLGSCLSVEYHASSGGAVYDHLRTRTDTAERIGAGVLARALLEHSTYECFLTHLDLNEDTRATVAEIQGDVETTLDDVIEVAEDYPGSVREVIRESCDHTLQTGRDALSSNSPSSSTHS